MYKVVKKFQYVLFFAVIISCSSEDELTEAWIADNQPEQEPVNPGTVDVSNYVAIGASITQGFADGALFPAGQASSYPAILAEQFKGVDNTVSFVNPDIVTAVDGTGRIAIDLGTALAFLETGQGSLADALLVGSNTGTLSLNTQPSINNYGVAGARSIDLVAEGYGNLNPFFGTFQSSGTATVLGDAAGANPTFFSAWVGGNDVLGYARNGGAVDVSDRTDPNSLTSETDFQSAVTGILDALSANGANGVIINVPPVTTLPYFQIATQLGGGINLIPLTRQGQVDSLNAAFNVSFPPPAAGVDPGYNSLINLALSQGIIDQAEADRRQITWSLGANPPLITDESLTPIDLSAIAGSTLIVPQLRQASATNLQGLGDVFPLDAIFVLGVEQADESIPGVTTPLVDSLTLTETEQGALIARTATFNGILAAQAQARENIVLVDINPIFADLNGLSAMQAAGLVLGDAAIAAADGVPGVDVDGFNLIPISFDQAEVLNSIFSTDFIHPNGRGAALIANEVIKAINAGFGASIEEADVLSYTGLNAILP